MNDVVAIAWARILNSQLRAAGTTLQIPERRRKELRNPEGGCGETWREVRSPAPAEERRLDSSDYCLKEPMCLRSAGGR